MDVAFQNDIFFPKGKEIETAAKELHQKSLNQLFPLGQETFSLTVKNVDVSIPNAISRSLMGEDMGMRLSIGDFYTNDSHMKPEVVRLQIQKIPLRATLREDEYDGLVFNLDVHNKTDSTKQIYSGDLRIESKGKMKPSGAYFNPTFIIADLQPGSIMTIKDIKVQVGQVSIDQTYSQISRCVCIPLGVPEHDPDTVRNTEKGIGRYSGFTVSTKMHIHLDWVVRGEVNAVMQTEPAAKKRIHQICNMLNQRLRKVQQILQQNPAGQVNQATQTGSSYWYTFIENGSPVLFILLQKETATIGELIKAVVLANNDNANLTYTPNDNTGTLSLRLAQNAPKESLPGTIHKAIKTITQQIEELKGHLQ